MLEVTIQKSLRSPVYLRSAQMQTFQKPIPAAISDDPPIRIGLGWSRFDKMENIL